MYDMAKILIIEDDSSISNMISEYLKRENFIVDTASDGQTAVEQFKNSEYDLVLLDLMLPKLSGKDVLLKIRGTSTVPVIVISAKDTDIDKALLLEIGADDYVAKPFSLIELLARVNANLRRVKKYSAVEDKSSSISIGDIVIDVDNFTVTKRNEALNLTLKEFEILKLLAQNPKRVFTKRDIYCAVWEDDYIGDEGVINVHIQRLRKKLEDNPSVPQYIKTIWGIGYRLGEF